MAMTGLQQLVAFVETAKHGSFAAAARELGSVPSTLAKAVTRLERSLAVRLFHRTTRQVSLTSDGERLFARCQRVLAELDELRAEAAGARATVTGTLRIDMPVVFGRVVMLPLLARLLHEHPQLALDARLSDTYADLYRDGLDVAIRVGELRDSTLVARRFASQTLMLVASPGYLERHGLPQRIDQLAGHAALVFRMPSTGRDRPWQFRQRGQPVDLHPQSRLRFNDGEAVVAAACEGLGIGQVPDIMAADAIAGGRLVELLPHCRPATMPISAVYPGARLLPQRMRAFLDALDSLRAASGGAPAAGTQSPPRPAAARRTATRPVSARARR